jgi:hypothetical protein
MYLIKAKSNEAVLPVVQDLDNIDDFEHLDLGEINSLELVEMNPDSSNWSIGEPVVFDEKTGVVLLNYSKESLTWFKNNFEILSKYGVLEETVESFCSVCNESLYCLDTF